MKTLLQTIVDNHPPGQQPGLEIALKDAISKLPKKEQDVLYWRYTKQLPVSEISKKLGCSLTTIYLRLNRALFILRNELNPFAYESMYRILYPETGRPGLVINTS